jgi:hypothetical protein
VIKKMRPIVSIVVRMSREKNRQCHIGLVKRSMIRVANHRKMATGGALIE